MRYFQSRVRSRGSGIREAVGFGVLAVLLLVGSPNGLYAQAPDWSVDPSEYEHSLTATVSVQVDGAPVADSGDVLGAFAGGVARGIARPDTSAGTDGLYFLSVYGDEAGQAISFRVYDASADTVRQAPRTLTFEPDATYGTPAHPYRLAIGEGDPPDVEAWTVRPSAYEQTMTITASVFIEPQDHPSDGRADKVAAFVDGEVRGVAEAEQVGDANLFFLTVHGDPPDADRALTLRYYDAATDRVFPTDEVELSFRANAVEGAPGDPVSVMARRPSAQVEGILDLGGIAPHPLDRDALVRFAADRNVRVRLVLYDAMGRRVRLLYEGRLKKNQTYRRRLRIEGLASGVYFLRLSGPRGTDTQRVAVVR